METYEISSNACLNPAGVNNENNFVRDQLRRSEQLGLFSSMPLPQATFEGESNETNGYFQFNSAKESADIIVKGWAALHGCPAEHIFLTTGKDRQYVGHTTAVKKRNDLVEKTVQRCMKTSGWEVQIDANIADGEGVESLEAWIWDEETNQMLPIKRSK
ncbi:hypothetical protein KJ996_02585 [Patescibacteria group bacterium]|nr:hypothetical protein [Patescibacteria group bacterium]